MICDSAFIAPGIFFEQNNYRAISGTDGDLKRLQIKNRYGVRSDFGYDVGRFAPYLTIGYAQASYRSRSGGYDTNDNRVSVVKNGIDGNVFYGAGLKFNLTSSLSLNTEYNFQKIAPKTTLSPLTQDYASKEPVANLISQKIQHQKIWFGSFRNFLFNFFAVFADFSCDLISSFVGFWCFLVV